MSMTTSTVDIIAQPPTNGTVPHEDEVKVKQVQVIVTQERMERIKVGVFLKVERENSLSAQIEFLSHFIADNRGVYYPQDEALAIIEEMEMGQVPELVQQITNDMGSISAPKK